MGKMISNNAQCCCILLMMKKQIVIRSSVGWRAVWHLHDPCSNPLAVVLYPWERYLTLFFLSPPICKTGTWPQIVKEIVRMIVYAPIKWQHYCMLPGELSWIYV